MGPLKKRKAVEGFLRNNPGQVVTLNNVAAFVKESFVQTATLSTAMNGFKATGIVPLYPEIFSDEDFAAADSLQILVQQASEQNAPSDSSANSDRIFSNIEADGITGMLNLCFLQPKQ